jgi:hypothetical protein
MTTSSSTSSHTVFKGRFPYVDRQRDGDFIGLIAIHSETEPNEAWMDYMNFVVGERAEVVAFMEPIAAALGRTLLYTEAAK